MIDLRVFFAAERTFLAWVRTGLAIMGFGFVVARFGLFLDLLSKQNAPMKTAFSSSHLSNIVGITFVLLGAATIFFAINQHRIFIASLPADELPVHHPYMTPMILALLLGTLGIVLSINLAFR